MSGNKGPNPVCPICGGRAWLDPATTRVKCLGRIVSWLETESSDGERGQRPVYGRPCGWSAAYAAGCCGGAAVNRWSGAPGSGDES